MCCREPHTLRPGLGETSIGRCPAPDLALRVRLIMQFALYAPLPKRNIGLASGYEPTPVESISSGMLARRSFVKLCVTSAAAASASPHLLAQAGESLIFN